jgi:hyaluronoglucosaminidase
MIARPVLVAALALAAACSAPPRAPLEPVAPLSLYPQPLYFVDAPAGVRYSHPQLAFDTALPPDLPPQARAAWDAAGSDRYVVIARYESGQAIVRAFGENDRAIGYATAAAKALVDDSGRLHLATIVDGSPFPLRGLIEGYYGAPMETWQRQCLLDRMSTLRANVYLYGPKDDPYAHQQWADPYPPDQAAALAETVAAARARNIDFIWSVSPGLQSGYPPPGTSISYASDADFARLTAKIDAMRALGVTRFALFLDDIVKSLVYDDDLDAFDSPVEAHVSLANRLDAYVTAAGSPHLLFVGPYYTNAFAGWDDWASDVGDLLAPGIDVMWTGPAVYPASCTAYDLAGPDALFGRDVVIWNNQPRAPVALSEYSPGLPGAARGFLSNTILLQEGYGYTFDDLWQVLGPLGDYAWNPAAYDPVRSLDAWSAILETAQPCGAGSGS